MPREHLGNEFATILSDAITYQDDIIRVANASGFPELQFRVRIGNELLRVYEVLPDLHSFRVQRGTEGTNSASHAQNSAVTIIATAGGLEQWQYDSYSEVPHGVVGAPEWRFLDTTTGLVYLDTAASGAGSVVHVSEGYEVFRSYPGAIGIKGDLLIVGLVSNEEDYPFHDVGSEGTRRIKGPMSGFVETSYLSFQNILPGQGSVIQILPSANYKPTALRFQDFAEPESEGGGYFDIRLDTSHADIVNWKVSLSTLIKTPPPQGPNPGPPPSLPIYFTVGDGTKMVIGKTGEGVTIGRHGTGFGPGMPDPGYLTIINGLEVGPSITGAGPGDGYFEGTVRGARVVWGVPDGSGLPTRSELLTNFNAANISGFYIADDAANAPQDNRIFLSLVVGDVEEGTQAQLILNADDSRELYVRAYGGAGNGSWFKVFHEGNTLPVFGGSGIFPGPIGIGTLADLTNKGDGDLVVYNSITIQNEPGALSGELRGPTGSLVRQAGFRGLAVSDRQETGVRMARFGAQVTLGTPGAWMSYGGAPGGLEGPTPSDVAVSAWRLGSVSIATGQNILAELLQGAGGGWASILQVNNTGIVVLSNGLTTGFGGLTTSGDILGRTITARSTETFVQAIAEDGSAVLRAQALSENGMPRLELIWGETNPPDVENPAKIFTTLINPDSGYLETIVGTEIEEGTPPSPPDAPYNRVLRIDENGSIGIGINPSGTEGVLSTYYGITVGPLATTQGAASTEVLSGVFSSIVQAAAPRRYHRFWGGAETGTPAGGDTVTNLGYNVGPGLTRDRSDIPSWLVRFGGTDKFEILRAASGGGPWTSLLLLDADGNLTSVGSASVFSAVNVGEALGAALGEIRMSAGLHLARSGQPSSRKILVDTSSTDPHTYAPFFEASGSTWIVRGPGTSGSQLQLRVAAASGTFQIATADGNSNIVLINDARSIRINGGVSLGMDGTSNFPFAPTDDLYVNRQIRAGRGDLALPAYSFNGAGAGEVDSSKAGIFYEYTPEDGGNVHIASVLLAGSAHNTVEITPKRVRINTHLHPLESETSIDTHYDVGGQGNQAWRFGYFHKGLTVGTRPGLPTNNYASQGQLRVYSQFPAPTVSGTQYISIFKEDSNGALGTPSYASVIRIHGQGHSTAPTMDIGMTYLPPDGTIEGYQYTDRYEGRPTHFIDISRGDFIIGIGGSRRFHMNRFGSVGIGNVDPTEPDPGDPTPPNVLGDMSIAKSLIVGAVNASVTGGGSEGEIIASRLTLVAGESGSQFSSPLILANNVPLSGRVSGSGDDYRLHWVSPRNDVHLGATPGGKMVFQLVGSDYLIGEVPTAVMHLWPNRGVVIGPLIMSDPPGVNDTPPPPDSGLRVDGDLQLGAALLLGPDTTIIGTAFTDFDIPFLGVGIGSIHMALLSQGEVSWGPGASEYVADTFIRRRTAGMVEIEESLYVQTHLGVGLTPAVALDVQTQDTTWASRIVNISSNGSGLYIRAGSDSSDTPLRVDTYPTLGVRLLTLDGGGGLALNGSMAVTDEDLADPLHPSTSRKGEIACEYLIVRSSTNYQFGGSATIDIESAGITLGNNIPLRAKDTTQTARSLLWVDTSNITHLRMATSLGLKIEGATTGAVALAVGNAGSLATGAGTPSANQGDLLVSRGLNVGNQVGAISGEVRAQLLSLSADASITGTVGIGQGLNVGSASGAAAGQVAIRGAASTAGLWISTDPALTTPLGSYALTVYSAHAGTYAAAFFNSNITGRGFVVGISAVDTTPIVAFVSGGTTRFVIQGNGLTWMQQAWILQGLNVGPQTPTAGTGQIQATSAVFTGTVQAANFSGGGLVDASALPDGTAALPSVRWSNSQHMGFWRIADNVIGASTNSVQRMEIGVGVGIGMASPLNTGDLAVNRSVMVGGPIGVTSGQIAALQVLAQPAGANPVATGYLQQFGAIVAGVDPQFTTYASAMQTEVGTGGANGRSSSVLLYTNPSSPGAGYGAAVYFASKPQNGVGDQVYAAIHAVVTAPAGSGFHTEGAFSFFVRRQYSDASLTEVVRIANGGVGVSRIPPAGTAGVYAAGPFDTQSTVTASGQITSNLGGQAFYAPNGYAQTGDGGAFGNQISKFVNLARDLIQLGKFYTTSTIHGIVVDIPSNSALTLFDGLATGTRQFAVWANGDVYASRGLNVGTGGTRTATTGEIANTGPFDLTYQASSPAAPAANHLKWWLDTRGSFKVTRPVIGSTSGSGGEWHLDVRENAFYNSDFDVWQRGLTFTGITTSQYTVDRWYISMNTGTLTVARTADQPTVAQQGGHHAPYCLRITSTAVVADGSLVAGSLVGARYSFEGRYWIRHIGRMQVFGTWVKSNRTITFSVAIRSGTLNRYFVQTFTIAVADVWQYVWFLVPPGTITDFGLDSNLGAEVWFILAAGSSAKGATTGQWTAGTLLASSSQQNLLSVAGSYLQISHLKLENNEAPTPCVGRPWEDDIRHMQRYYVKTLPYDVAPAASAGLAGALNAITVNNVITGIGTAVASWRFPVPMRVTPTTITTYNPAAAGSNWTNGVAASLADQSSDGVAIIGTLASSNGIRAEIHVAAHADF